MKKTLTALALSMMTLPASANVSVLEEHASQVDIGYCSNFVSNTSKRVFDNTVDHTVNTVWDNDLQTMVSFFDAEFSDGSSKNGSITLNGTPKYCMVSVQENFYFNQSCIKLAIDLNGKADSFGSSVLVRTEGVRFILTPVNANLCNVLKAEVQWFENNKGGF
jgi:hypothetical protein